MKNQDSKKAHLSNHIFLHESIVEEIEEESRSQRVALNKTELSDSSHLVSSQANFNLNPSKHSPMLSKN